MDAPTVTPRELIEASRLAGVEDLYDRVVMAFRNELNDTIVYDKRLQRWVLDPAKSSEVLRRWNDFVSERRARVVKQLTVANLRGVKPCTPVSMNDEKWRLRSAALECFIGNGG